MPLFKKCQCNGCDPTSCGCRCHGFIRRNRIVRRLAVPCGNTCWNLFSRRRSGLVGKISILNKKEVAFRRLLLTRSVVVCYWQLFLFVLLRFWVPFDPPTIIQPVSVCVFAFREECSTFLVYPKRQSCAAVCTAQFIIFVVVYGANDKADIIRTTFPTN